MSEEHERTLTTNQLAQVLNITESTVREKAKKGQIPSMRIGRDYRFLLGDVLTALRTPVVKGATN